MDKEFEGKKENSSSEQEENHQDQSPSSSSSGQNLEKPMRQRIRAQRVTRNNYVSNNAEQANSQGYNYRKNPSEYSQREYRPRYQEEDQAEYRSRPNQYRRPQSGYRPRYQDDYQQGYPQRSQDGYRPRYQEDNQQRYPQRNGYLGRSQDGYHPHYSQEGQRGYRQRYQDDNQQGYPQRNGYLRPRYNNGYSQRPQGGYRPRAQEDYDSSQKYNLKKRIEYKETNIDPNEPIRLNKYLANSGICSRREADEYIQAGAVTVNREVVTELGTKISRKDEVKFNQKDVSLEKKVYVLLNKPKDCVTTVEDTHKRRTVMDLVEDACTERIYPVGRLDRNTTGVLLLTNDGELASKLTHPQFMKKKIYHVFLDKNVTAYDMQQIANGITLEDGEVHADAIEYASPTDKSQIGIEIHSGKNRIVRRIFESLGYKVLKLDRVLFAGLTKKGVRRGDWRYLTEKEVDMLRMGAFE